MPLTMTRPRPKRLRNTLRVLSGAVLTLLVIVALVILKVASSGIPSVFVERLADICSSAMGFAVEFEDVRLTPFGSGSIGEIRLFDKGSTLPGMTFLGTQFQYRWNLFKGGLPILPTRLEIREADIRSLDLFDNDDESSGEPGIPAVSELPVLSADIAVRSLRFLGTPAGRVRIHLDSDGRRLAFTNIRANIAERGAPPQNVGGELTLHVVPPPPRRHGPPRPRRILEGRLSGNLVPAGLNPILRSFESETLPEIFSGFEFPVDPPHADVIIDIRADSRSITADVNGGRCLYNGVPIVRFSGVVEVLGDGNDWTDVKVRGLEITRPEGHVNANIHFDFQRHGMIFDASSTLDFAHLAKILDILSSVPWDSYETSGGNNAVASGYYAFSESAEPSDVRGRVTAGAFSFRRRVPARDLSADLRVEGEKYRFSNIRANLYGGTFDGSACLWPDATSDDMMLAVTGAVQKASAGLVNHDLFGGLDDDPGVVNVRFDATLDVDRDPLRSATGHLWTSVRGARLFRTPVFAGFTDFLSENVPGLDIIVTQDDAQAEAVIGDNGIHFKTVRVEGPLVSISGDGSYWFSDHLDFGFRVHLFKHRTIVGKALKFILYPLSKLFEMEVTGPLLDPSWSPTTLALSSRGEPTDEQKYGRKSDTPAPDADGAAPRQDSP